MEKGQQQNEGYSDEYDINLILLAVDIACFFWVSL